MGNGHGETLLTHADPSWLVPFLRTPWCLEPSSCSCGAHRVRERMEPGGGLVRQNRAAARAPVKFPSNPARQNRQIPAQSWAPPSKSRAPCAPPRCRPALAVQPGPRTAHFLKFMTAVCISKSCHEQYAYMHAYSSGLARHSSPRGGRLLARGLHGPSVKTVKFRQIPAQSRAPPSKSSLRQSVRQSSALLRAPTIPL